MSIAIYHRIMEREGFEEAAKALMGLLQDAQEKKPNEPRDLYLDISGHRNEKGGFDAEMVELQQEFVLGFLGKYFTNVHMPLISVANSHEQDNEIPSGLAFINFDKDSGEDKLAALYIENYSNTEFASEISVYEFLERVSRFLVKLRDMHPMFSSKNETGNSEWRFHWCSYLVDLMTELFNGFVLGNLISVSAMTRTLIESYAYISVFDRNEDSDLVDRWYVFNALPIAQEMTEQGEVRGEDLLRKFCETTGISYEEAIEKRRRYGENGWLCSLMGDRRISFRDICDFLGEPTIYEDFQRACSYIHGQDITTKASPFTYYAAIFGKLYLMMDYMFKVVPLLFPNEEEMLKWVDELYDGLYMLGDKYVLEQE